jgi:hypothetical protein
MFKFTGTSNKEHHYSEKNQPQPVPDNVGLLL